jgi:O-acetyl-ADP-ribose deacetylase (regulator of RNase III)
MAETIRENINVFICCNQESPLGKRKAERIYNVLKHKFQTFLESENMMAGEDVEKKTFDFLLGSDVLILLIERGIEDSRKVRREVLSALGAQVGIIPYVIQQPSNISVMEERLGIERLQHFREDESADLANLCREIQKLAREARSNRQKRTEEQLAELRQHLETNEKTIRVFISYRRTELSIEIANCLYDEFQSHYEMFYDKHSMDTGKRWDDRIFSSVLKSNVLLLLFEDATKDSDWVEREVTYARASGVRILPYLVDPSLKPEDAKRILEHLGVGNVRYLIDNPLAYPKLHEQIKSLAKRTVEDRQNKQETAKANVTTVVPAASKTQSSTNPRGISFQLRGDPRTVHLATGAIDAMQEIDVLVNTENNYLQMSRIHEPHTVSSRLRYQGALINIDGLMLEDTVQVELDAFVNHVYKARPVPLTSVIPTHAGHTNSVLCLHNKARYIFHAVTTQVFQEFRKDTMIPIQTDEGMKTCVLNALEMVKEVDEANGLILPDHFKMPDGRSPYEGRAPYTPIRSIIFPIFGTGHAGRKIREVIKPMLRGIQEFLVANPDYHTLQSIHICVFYQEDIPQVQKAMSEIFEPVPRNALP